MAQLSTYKCKRCGYDVMAEPLGHYSLMSGEYYNFRCYKCRDIVSLSAKEIYAAGYDVKCPVCGSDKIACWSPLNGKCPVCDGEIEEILGCVMMAD